MDDITAYSEPVPIVLGTIQEIGGIASPYSERRGATIRGTRAYTWPLVIDACNLRTVQPSWYYVEESLAKYKYDIVKAIFDSLLVAHK